MSLDVYPLSFFMVKKIKKLQPFFSCSFPS
jgi:hypothetical protein